MSITIHIDKHQDFWLTYEYLLNKGVSQGTINNWITRNDCFRKLIENIAYVAYDTIPERTRRKLPSKEELKTEYNYLRFKHLENRFFEELEKAYNGINANRWQNQIMEEYEGIQTEKANELGRKAVVIERAVEIHRAFARSHGSLMALHNAYLRLYPGSYSMKNRFCQALTKARKEGVLSVAVDRRLFTAGRPEKYAELHKYYALVVLSHNKSYDLGTAYDIFSNACMGDNIEVPSIQWFELYKKTNKNLIERHRLGESASDDKNRTYAKIIPALYAGDQWQIDGWNIPVFCKIPNGKGGFEYWKRLVLFAVLDANTRRIVGYRVGMSENTEVILKGLEMAVKRTSCIPYEIVSDNHSFNKTKEAGSLKEDMEQLGSTWTVDSNPRRKAILERAFRTLGDKHYKMRYGYIGQGVKTKIENGITQQELRDLYQKPDNFLTYEQVIALTVDAVETYNNSIIKKLGDTPNNLYEASEKPNAIPVDLFKRMSLFTRKSEHKVSHGQITIIRAGQTYEYQLPAEYSEKYNNQVVTVCYADFNEIFLFEKGTDQPICGVRLKSAIHGALANQAEADKEQLFKNKGRITGIKTKGRKKKENLFDGANTINPEAYEHINKLTASKDVLKGIQDSEHKQNIIIDEYNINPGSIKSFPIVDEMLDASLKPRKKGVKNPFQVEYTGELKKIIINGEGTPQM